MLTAEIKINGILIGHLYLHNKTPVDQIHFYPKHPNLYYVEYYEIGTNKVQSVEVEHIRNKGALVLIKKAIEALKKKEKK